MLDTGVMLDSRRFVTFELCDRRAIVNIFDSTRPVGRMLAVLRHIISETTYRSLRSRAQGLPTPHAVFCWALIVSVLLPMVSGCGRQKKELASAKQQIEKLNSEVKRLTDETARLKQETSRLSDESKALSDKNTRLQRDLDALNKAKAAISTENSELKKKNSAAEEEIASLKREKGQVAQEVQEYKKRVTETAPPPKAPAATSTEVVPGGAKRMEELSPCDAVVAFMKASEEVVRRQKGPERAKSLEQVKQQYAPRMKGAPAKAIKAAENWVKVGTKFWDQVGGEGTLQLIQLRGIVLEACGKSPKEAGF